MGSWQKESRDEDLALFHDMRRRERKNFLYPLKDDFDSSPRHDGLSTFCVSASTPTRNRWDLLTMDSEKNDYNWLLTPPSTPLFPSLDQDVPIVNLSQRRVLTRSASVSKTARLSYTQEPSPRTHGGNPSPRRPSTASSTSSTSTSRGRPLSPSLTSRSSPTLRASSPCRPITPTGRNTAGASRTTSRSSTPTLRRNNTSPSSINRAGPTNGRSRGKSLSPKLGPWGPCLAGFSAEPPPNLRTTLSDRTIQRGGSQVSRNGSAARTRGDSAETLEDSQEHWHVMSPDRSGNWSLSHANEHNSSLTSRVSVVSSCDDDLEMAESVVSGSTKASSDSGPKAANVPATKLEDSNSRRSVLPAKRQMRQAGTTGDTTPFLSLAAKKTYERQAAQRRSSSQAMFRPLLSSVPATSFYTSRAGATTLRSSSPLTEESSVSVLGSSLLSRNDGLHGEIAHRDHIFDSSEQDMKKEELASTIPTLGLEHQGGSEMNSSKEIRNHICVNEQKDDTDQVILGTLKECDAKEDQISSICSVSAQHIALVLRRNSSDYEDMVCDTDPETIDSNLNNGRCLEGQHAHKFSLTSDDRFARASSLLEQSTETEHIIEESKVKEHNVEEQKLGTPVKSHSYLGVISNLGSPHGAQRTMTDFGSFRKQSPMKLSNTRSHDGSMIIEKAISCDSFRSESHGLLKSLASAFGNGEPIEVPLECSSDVLELPVTGNEAQSFDKPLGSVEKDGLGKQLLSMKKIGDVVEGISISESSATEVSETMSVDTNQPEFLNDHADVKGLISAVSEVGCEQVSFLSEATDKLSQQDVLSIIGSCASKIGLLEDDVEHDGCITMQGRCLTDATHMTSRPASEASEGVDLSQVQQPGVALLKRSVTLEEATDTILFCNSIVHELVYKAATLAIQNEEQKAVKSLSSKRDFVTLFGFSGTAEPKTNGGKIQRPRNRKRDLLSGSTVRETSSYVQKQRMVHRQSQAVTMRQSPMDRIENAVMGNHEEIQAPKVTRLQKKKKKQSRRLQCGCTCCMM